MMQPSFDPLVAAWEMTLARKGDAPAIFDTRRSVLRSFQQIEAEAGEIQRRQLDGIELGAVVGIQLGNHPAWPACLLACLRQGLVALPLERAIAERERDAALEICKVAAIAEPGTSGITVRRLSHETVKWNARQPVLLKLTSGTTAAPRAIRFSSAQLLADCVQICETMGITEHDLNFGVIPLSHSYGFSNLVTPLLARGVALVMSRDRMPRALLDDLERSGATVFPGMPVFYQALCAMDSLPTLPQLRLCISAGAPLPTAMAREFRAKLGKPIHSFYGSSECGGICYDREATLLEQGFVGEPMNDVALEVLEPQAEASLVWVRSAAAGDGYFPAPDQDKLGNGYFAPDDLLARRRDGFCIAGRVSEVINVAGKKVNPAEVEAVLRAFAGVSEAVVFGRDSSLRNEEVAACVAAGPEVDEFELLEFCRARLSGWQVPKRIFFTAEIPVNERGKINRRALAKRFRH